MSSDSIDERLSRVSSEIRHITEELRILHLREAVLKDRLARRITTQVDLNIQRERISELVPVPVPAVLVESRSSESQRITNTPTGPLDCDGNRIEVGDEVNFLTKGANTSSTGIVNRITDKFIHCTDSHQNRTKRLPKNLKITDKFHEC